MQRAMKCPPPPPPPAPSSAGVAGAAHLGHVDPLAWGAGVLGAFLAFQAGRVKFVFDDDALEVRHPAHAGGSGWGGLDGAPPTGHGI